MNLYLDTATSDFLIILFNNNIKIIDHLYIKDVPKKVNLLVENFELILKRNSLNTYDIKSFYLNLGPGFFTGIRISLIFLRTVALIHGQKIFTTSTFKILNFINPNLNEMFLDAQGDKVFYLNKANFSKENYIDNIEIIPKDNQLINKVDYNKFINEFFNSITIFQEESDLLNINPYYIKKPQIGNKK